MEKNWFIAWVDFRGAYHENEYGDSEKKEVERQAVRIEEIEELGWRKK